ncbi:hypothetical protein BX616_007515 [Lobosporangium transversale]|uniref:Alcohol acetyltransferase-domain-containing protein n=1 Tax=Lobosporangium transversale TaxID=64571 RepID=A0A1Y2H3M8_9FUNG|nr:alcohol acetyltransferase-domain-containing protein [Lobosporangium transversale]KAF9914813.1 hypothetical protein BX616_007515 [Lobosporangium transversale]ORZ27672.1 alcohol acetyltransferase-domain-containing protein [Lobosporangium transversale]|eukprot:XP_021885375.1 alcohol acetyltransferase-domain-containing protein [Lobosporangium transversale]
MPLQVIRAVDNLERYSIARSNVNIYHNVAVGNRIQLVHSSFVHDVITASLHEWVQLLLTPVTQLIESHPSLSAVLSDYLTAKPVFMRLETINLLQLVRIVPVSLKEAVQIAQILEEEHNIPFDLSDQTSPLWRLVIAPIEKSSSSSSFYLLFVFHHVIADGRSAMTVTEQLIQHLNTQAQGRQAYPRASADGSNLNRFNIPIRHTNPIPLSIESRVNCYPSLWTLITEASRALLLPGSVKKILETKYWAGEIDSTLEEPNVTEMVLLQFTQSETSRVIQAAKRSKTTVQSILFSGAVFATKNVFMTGQQKHYNENYDRSGKSEEAIVFATPVSLRDLIPIPIPSEDLGNYTSEILHNNIRIHEESEFWETSRVYREQVIRGTRTKKGLQDLLEHFGMLSLLPKSDGAWEAFMASKVYKDQHGRKASVKLSNLGRGWTRSIPSDEDGRGDQADGNGGTLNSGKNGVRSDTQMFSIKDAIFSQSSGVTASALTMNVATANNIMTVTTTWQKAGFKGRARGELFVSEFKRILFEAIETMEKGKEHYFFMDAVRNDK